MPGARLSAAERETIADGLSQGAGYAGIAERLGRPTSTVSREVGRNGGRSEYTARIASLAAQQRARRGREHRGSSHGRAPTSALEWRGSPHARDVRQFAEHFAAMLSQAGMSRMPARVFAALIVSEAGELTARALRSELSISPGSVSKAVRYLEAFGLVHRSRANGRDTYRFSGDWVETFTRREALFAPWEDGALRGARLFGPETERGARFVELAHFMRIVRGTIIQIRERWRRAPAS